MAEVGALKVSLKLDSANFSQSMSQIDRKMRALRSEFKAASGGSKDFEKSLSGLKARSDQLKGTLQLQQQRVAQLRKEYERSAREQGRNAKVTENLLIRYNNSVGAMKRTENQLQNVNNAIKEQENPWNRLSKSMEKNGQTLQNVGQGMSNFGRSASLYVTAPLVAMGTGVIKTGMDFEASMSKVQAISGATGKDFESLKNQAMDLGAKTVFSASEAASGMEYLALAGWKTQDILDGMPGLLDLAAAGAMDLGRAADIVSDTMSAFGMEATKAGHAADVFAYAQANANTNVEQMGEAMKYVAPVANTMGWSLEGASAGMMALADNGLKGSIAGQAFASSLGRLAKPTKEMSETMNELGIKFFDAEGKMKPLPKVVAELEKATKGMTQEQKSATLTTLFGAEAYKHWAILLNTGSDELSKMTKELEASDGAASKMAKTMQDNAAGKMKEFQSAMEGLSITLANHVLPYVTKAIQSFTNMARKLDDMSPVMQKTIMAIAGLAAAFGPAILIAGKFTTSIGSMMLVTSKLLPVLKLAGGATGILRVGFAALTGPIGLTVAGVAGATLAFTKFYKSNESFRGIVDGVWGGIKKSVTSAKESFEELPLAIQMSITPLAGLKKGFDLYKHANEKAIESTKGFSEEVSKSTEKAVNSYLKMDEKAALALNKVAWSQQEITGKMAEDLISNYDQMNATILNKMDEKHAKQIEKTQKYFADTSALNDEEKAQVLEKMQQQNEQEVQKVQEGKERIKEIITQAKDKKRAITREEQQEINAIQEQMKTKAIETMSKSQVEQKAILEQLKAEANVITAEQAAQVVANSVKQKDKVVKEANEQYVKTKSEIEYLRDDLGVISTEQADKLIKEAQRQRDETVKSAEETHSNVVNEAQAQAGEHVNHVNWETGEVKSNWQVMKDTVSKRVKEIKDNTGKRWSELKNDTATKFKETKQKMVKPINEARDKIKDAVNKIKGFFDNLKLKIPKPELPQLPEFSLKTSTRDVMGKSITYPSGINVKWHATGGVFQRPVIAGNAGFGDVEEAIVPFEGPHASRIAGLIAEQMDRLLYKNKDDKTEVVIYPQDIYLDGEKIAEVTYDHTGRIKERKELRNLFDGKGV